MAGTSISFCCKLVTEIFAVSTKSLDSRTDFNSDSISISPLKNFVVLMEPVICTGGNADTVVGTIVGFDDTTSSIWCVRLFRYTFNRQWLPQNSDELPLHGLLH